MKQKLSPLSLLSRHVALLSLAGAGFAAPLAAQSGKSPQYPVPSANFRLPAASLQASPLPVPTAITPNGAVVEDMIARVNDQIITRTEYERSQQQLVQEAQQGGASQGDLDERQKNLLRDMIDQQLLLSKGKELGITGDAETIRRLDDLRKQNHLDSMEALEKAATQQGVSFEDFKQGIRNQVVTQQVVREEVGRRVNLTHAQEEAYYAEHSHDFEQPEQVHLSEILIPTPENATDAQVTAAQAKADEIAAKLKSGASFSDVAKSSSGGPTASAGGDLGDFKRGTLGTVLENATFGLPLGGVTAPIRTRQGFVLLKVDAHQSAGVAPLKDVEPQVQEAIYVAQLQPALRVYLSKARRDAYVLIKDGFVDTGSDRKESKPLFTAYAPPPVKKKVLAKQKAEQEKAVKAQAELAAAREKVQEKAAAKAASNAKKNGGTVDVALRPAKAPKIHREKVRYGQAPRNALPTAPVASLGPAEPANPPLAGQAAGAAMAPTTTATVVSSGTGTDTDSDVNPLTPQAPVGRKTRLTSRHAETEESRAETKLVKAEAKATKRPTAATAQESATEKQQAAPLGLNGDTKSKKPKPKRDKDEPKERLQEKTKPAEEKVLVAPTVNPVLAPGAPATKPAAADQTTLPPATAPAPGTTPPASNVPPNTPGPQ